MKNKNNKQFFRSIVNYLYLYPYSYLKKRSSLPKMKGNARRSVKIAFICDEMTWVDYSDYATSVFIHPQKWKKQLKEFEPDILFCESAWCGIDEYLNCWRGRIYKDGRLFFENRKELLEILEYCGENGIKTVFWNKEDPMLFNHPIYDFTSTALLFDYIFTTAIECVEQYKALGHKKVGLLPFGVKEEMFNPEKRVYTPNTVIFAGSWFPEQKARCKNLEKLLDHVIAKGKKLDIYDRKSECKGTRFRFPVKYKKCIHKAVLYSEIPDLCKKYEYAVNVNSVTESPTMFSRRLLQMAACGLKVITNSSVALSQLTNVLELRNISDDIVLIKAKNQSIAMRFSTEQQLSNLLDLIKDDLKNG